MKKSLKIVLSAILIMGLVSCAGNFQYYDVTNSSEIVESTQTQVGDNIGDNIGDNEQQISVAGNLEIFIKKVSMDDVEDGRTYQILEYPELSCTNNDYINAMLKDLTEQSKNDVIAFRVDNKEYVREMINTAEDDSYMKELMFSYTKDAEVVTNDGKYLSILINTFMDTGGAHPNYLMNGYTYDVEINKPTDLYDFITDKEEFRQFLKDYVVAHKDELYEDADQTVDNYIDNPPNDYGIDYHIDYYIKDKQFHIVFQTYELAPHAAGIIDIIVDNSLLKVNL